MNAISPCPPRLAGVHFISFSTFEYPKGKIENQNFPLFSSNENFTQTQIRLN